MKVLQSAWRIARGCLLAAALVVPADTLADSTTAAVPQLDPTETAALKANPLLRVLYDPAGPPFVFSGDDGSAHGLFVDEVTELAKLLGVRVEFLPSATWKEALARFENGEAEIILPLSRSPEREQRYAFTQPMARFNPAIFARREQAPVAGIDGLIGLRLAQLAGSEETRRLRERQPQLTIQEVPDVRAALEAVSTGAADALVGNPAVIRYAAHAALIENLQIVGIDDGVERVYPLGLQKSLTAVASAFDKAMAVMPPEQLDAIRARWLDNGGHGTPDITTQTLPPPIDLSADERAWLAAHPVIRLGGDPAWPPIDFVDEQGHYSGLSADFVELLAKRLGIKFDYQYGLSWNQVLAGVRSADKVDLVTSVGDTPQREQFLLLTKPYLAFQSVIVTRTDADFGRSLAAMVRQSFVMPRDYTETVLMRQLYPELIGRMREVDNSATALREVSLGRADATVGNIAVLHYLIEQGGYTNLKIAAPAFDDKIQMRFGVRKDWPQLAALLDKAIATITPQEHEAIFSRWHAVEVAPGLDPRAVVRGVLSVALPALATLLFVGYWALRMRREIRARKIAEAELLEAQRQLQANLQRTSGHLAAIMSNAPAAIWAKNLRGVYIFANDAFRSIHRLPPDYPVTGRDDFSLFAQDLAEGFRSTDEQVLRNGETQRFVEPLVHRDTRIEMLSVKFPMRSATDEIEAVGGFAIEITEQIRLQEELKTLNASLEQRVAERTAAAQAALHLARDRADEVEKLQQRSELAQRAGRVGIYDADLVTGANFWNDVTLEIFGITRAEFEGDADAWSRRLHPDDRETAIRTWRESIEGTGTSSLREFRICRPDGSVRWVRSDSRVFRNESGTALRSIGVNLDITQQKELEQSLSQAREAAEAAARVKSEFLANMSHEIRTPMNAIIGMSHLALQTDLSPKQRNYIGKIDNAAKSLLGIVNDVLDFSKIEAGKLTIEHVNFSLQSVLDNLTTLIAQKAQEKGLELLFDIDSTLPDALIGDPLRLGQVLTNFCSNAVKFTDRGEIVVSARIVERDADEIEVRFSVRDTGIGLSTEQRDRLFQAFHQADSSITRRYGGTGLGLTISKRIIESMDGEVGVNSEPGQGSDFWFSLPFGVQSTTQPVRMMAAADIERCRVLVADDNATAREILVDLARSLRMEVSAVSSGSEAMAELSAARDRPFDVVLMDWRMPGLSGAQTARAIQHEEGLVRKPAVIMVSAYGRDDVFHELDGLQVDGVLTKPVNASMLLNTLLGALGKDIASAPAAPHTGEHRSARLEGARVLLVEDNEINQEVANEILQREGLQVTIANHGREAIECLQARPYDVVLMDMQMPVMDGVEASRAIRSEARFADVPIIAMTANVMSGDLDRCFAAGMNDHIAKPIDIRQLVEVLLKWLPQYASRPSTGVAAPRWDETDRLPASLSGIDLNQGLRNMAGSPGLYRKILLKFRDTQTDAATRIEAALKVGDLETALRDAHTLKGLSGSIAAQRLHQASKNLEQAIKRGDGVVADVIQPLVKALTEVIVGIAPLDSREERHGDQGRRGTGGAVANFDRLQKSLRELKRRLDDDDASAVHLIESLMSDAAETGHATLLVALCTAVDRFDFDSAKGYLIQLQSSLEIELP